MTDEQWHRTIAVNLDSVFGLIKHSVAQMKKQRGQSAPAVARPPDPSGHIVLVSSTAGQRGEAFHCDYAASKGAVISMVKGLSTELARDGIRVNCVAPGKGGDRYVIRGAERSADAPKVFGTIPLGRVGTPDEIAGPILFLCTPYAGFITGEIFNVNGGAVLVG